MKEKLKGILDKVNAFKLENGNVSEFKGLLQDALSIFSSLKAQHDNPMLEAWIDMGLTELDSEINKRLGPGYENNSADKQRSELMYSRSSATMAITNVMMHL